MASETLGRSLFSSSRPPLPPTLAGAPLPDQPFLQAVHDGWALSPANGAAVASNPTPSPMARGRRAAAGCTTSSDEAASMAGAWSGRQDPGPPLSSDRRERGQIQDRPLLEPAAAMARWTDPGPPPPLAGGSHGKTSGSQAAPVL